MMGKMKTVVESAKIVGKIAPSVGKIAPTAAKVINPVVNTVITGIEVTKITISTLGSVMSEFMDQLGLKQMSLDEIAQAHDKPLQACIANEKMKGNHYAAGKLFIDYVNQEKFQVSYEMYFQNDEGKVFKAANKSLQDARKFLTSEAVMELLEEQHIEYPVEEDVA